MRPAYLALVLFTSFFLFLSLSQAADLNTGSDLKPTTLILWVVEHDDPATPDTIQTAEAFLFLRDVKSETGLTKETIKETILYWQWQNQDKPEIDGLPNLDMYLDSTGHELEPLTGKTIEFYLDENGNFISVYLDDAGEWVVDPEDILCGSAVTSSEGIASLELPPACIPDLECKTIIASYTPEGADAELYSPSTDNFEICGDFTLPLGSIDATTCLPVFLLFGLLAGAMYAAGRSPLALFDISTPRLPRPKPYGMRRLRFSPGGAMQRMALNKQLRLSQKLTNITIRRAAKHLEKDGIASSEQIRRLLAQMRAKMRPSNHEIAAALRLMGSNPGLSAERALAAVRRIGKNARDRALKQQGKGMSKDVEGLVSELAYNNAMRRIIHVGSSVDDEAEGVRGRGAGVFGGRKRLKYHATFRALHDSLWMEENARRALAANLLAFGGHNWFGLSTFGGWLGGQADAAFGSNRFGKWGKTVGNIGPRLADKGFLGALFVGTFGKAKVVGDLTVKLVKDGVPAVLGIKRSRAKVFNAADAHDALKKGLEKQKAIVEWKLKRLQRYLNMKEKDLKEVVLGVEAKDFKKALKNDALRRRWEAIKKFREEFKRNPSKSRALITLQAELDKLYQQVESLKDPRQMTKDFEKINNQKKLISLFEKTHERSKNSKMGSHRDIGEWSSQPFK